MTKSLMVFIALFICVIVSVGAQHDLRKSAHIPKDSRNLKLGTALTLYGLYGITTRNWFYHAGQKHGLKNMGRYSLRASQLSYGGRMLGGLYLLSQHFDDQRQQFWRYYFQKK
jgi:hypothetical protein